MSVFMNRKKQKSQVAERLMFLPTGEVFKDERNSSYYHSDFLFSGKELDAETGNYYYGARYYAPRIGIWLSPDPLQLKYPHVSSYAYCEGNPVAFSDPLGLKKHNWVSGKERNNVSFYQKRYDNSLVQIWAHGLRKTEREKSIGIQIQVYYYQKQKTGTGYFRASRPEEKDIESASDFAKVLDKYDSGWRKSNSGKPIIILHACATSEFAREISADEEFKDVVIIAPNATLYSGKLANEKVGSIVTGKNLDTVREGQWEVYKNGKPLLDKLGNPITYGSTALPGTKDFDYGF